MARTLAIKQQIDLLRSMKPPPAPDPNQRGTLFRWVQSRPAWCICGTDCSPLCTVAPVVEATLTMMASTDQELIDTYHPDPLPPF